MIKLGVFFMILLLAAVFDMKDRMIPDWIHLLLIAVGLIPPAGVHALGAIAAMPLLIAGTTIGGIGGGDIKLTGACGLVLGFGKTFYGLLTALSLVILFHFGRQMLRMTKDNKNDGVREQAYPLVPFLMIGMLMSIQTGG